MSARVNTRRRTLADPCGACGAGVGEHCFDTPHGRKPYCRSCREQKRALRDLSATVSGFIVRLDAEMKLPSDYTRGKRIAALTNALDMSNDLVRYNHLGVNFRTDKKARP